MVCSSWVSIAQHRYIYAAQHLLVQAQHYIQAKVAELLTVQDQYYSEQPSESFYHVNPQSKLKH